MLIKTIGYELYEGGKILPERQKAAIRVIENGNKSTELSRNLSANLKIDF